jgi:hypothetical protein
MEAVSSCETERCDDDRKPIFVFLEPNASSVRGRKDSFSVEPLYFLRSEQIFLVQGSHRRVRLRSVDGREHILLEHDAYINNSERETIIF